MYARLWGVLTGGRCASMPPNRLSKVEREMTRWSYSIMHERTAALNSTTPGMACMMHNHHELIISWLILLPYSSLVITVGDSLQEGAKYTTGQFSCHITTSDILFMGTTFDIMPKAGMYCVEQERAGCTPSP